MGNKFKQDIFEAVREEISICFHTEKSKLLDLLYLTCNNKDFDQNKIISDIQLYKKAEVLAVKVVGDSMQNFSN